MKKGVIVKMSFFSIISIAFVMYLFYYSEALATERNRDEHNFAKEFFLSRISIFENFDFAKENMLTKEDTIVKSFSVDPKGTLKVDVSDGDVELATWDKNEVKVVVKRNGTEGDFENQRLSFENTKNSVTIKLENTKKLFNFGKNASIIFYISVPKQFYPDIKTSGGDITINGIFSDSKLVTSGGDICIFKSTGNQDVKTSGGDIKISSNKGNINAVTSGGDVVFKEINGDVNITTSGGDIVMIEMKGSIIASTSGGDIKAEILEENKGVSLSTSGGDIDLKFFNAIKADLDCKTSSGDVSLDTKLIFEGTIKSSSIIGKLNGGGPQIKAKTSGGDITLKFNN